MAMDSGIIRSLVREVLAEELARFKAARGGKEAPTEAPATAAGPREEGVRIESDADLMAFARRLLAVAEDVSARRDIADGRRVFRLVKGAGAASDAGASADEGAAVFEKGLVTERWIEALEPNTKRLKIGKTVHFTPLARDRARQRGITIERMS